MQIVFHTRQANLADDFKAIAKEKLETLSRFNVNLDRIEVEIIHEQNPKQGKHSHKVVITSHGSGPLLRAEATGFNDLAAFDDAVRGGINNVANSITGYLDKKTKELNDKLRIPVTTKDIANAGDQSEQTDEAANDPPAEKPAPLPFKPTSGSL